jgi:hypothetical protein
MRTSFAIVALVLVIAPACSTTTAGGARQVKTTSASSHQTSGAHLSQAELQQDVQRVATVFMDHVAQTGDPSEHHAPDALPPARKQVLMRRVLSYVSAALDIATGPYPEVNALDMVVFAMLCRDVLERHWIPHILGPDGAPLRLAFTNLEDATWGVAVKFLDERQQNELRDQIAAWQLTHSDQFRVEGVRFQEFSGYAGNIESDNARRARGLLSQVKTGIRTADQALLISERAFFAAHRMPFLLRLQARLGAHETLSDSLSQLNEVDALLEQVPELRLLVADMSQLANNAEAVAHEARLLIEAIEPHLQKVEARPPKDGSSTTETLAAANRLTKDSLELLREIRASVPKNPSKTLAAAEQRANGLVRRWMLYLFILGVALSAFFWTAYFIAKRGTQ